MPTHESEYSHIAPFGPPFGPPFGTPFAAAATHLIDISPFGPLLTAAAVAAAHCH